MARNPAHPFWKSSPSYKKAQAKKLYTKKTNPGLIVIRKNGRKVKPNTSVKMSLRDLRRLVSGARTGKPVRVKARVR